MRSTNKVNWLRWRRLARGVRISILLVLFALVVGLGYLNQVGLPEFMKEPLLAELRALGLDLRFSRMRLHWIHGIVAENVDLGAAADEQGPRFSIREVELQLKRSELFRLRFRVAGIVIRKGRMVWPLQKAGHPPTLWTVEDIMAELRFLPEDQWRLDQFKARTLGAGLNITGAITNASAIRSWDLPGSTNQSKGHGLEQLRQIVSTLEAMTFARPAEIKFRMHGDARRMPSFSAHLAIHLPEAKASWGTMTNAFLSTRMGEKNDQDHNVEMVFTADRIETDDAQVQQPALVGRMTLSWTNPLPSGAVWKLALAHTQTRWGHARRLEISAKQWPTPIAASNTDKPPNPDIQTELVVLADQWETPWGSAEHIRLHADLSHALNRWIPLAADGHLSVKQLQTRPGSVNQSELNFRLGPADAPALADDAGLAWWPKLYPYSLGWDADLAGVNFFKLNLESVRLAGQWQAPEFQVTNLLARLYEGEIRAKAKLNVSSRELNAATVSDFDLHGLDPLFPTNSLRFWRKFAWEKAPHIEAQASLTMPAWTNRSPAWRTEILPTLLVAGQFNVGASSYKTIPVTSGRSHVLFSNLFWHFPDMHVTRPEGQADLNIVLSSRTQEYTIGVRGRLDPTALVPLFGEASEPVLELFSFPEALTFDGIVWGPWTENREGALAGLVTVTNFTFRGEPFRDLTALIQYTNRFLFAQDTVIHHEDQQVTATALGHDFNQGLLYLTNAQSTMDPLLVARLIHSKLVDNLAPYQFARPPQATVDGMVSTQDSSLADLRFDIAGGPFTWTRFHLPQISAQVHWLSNSLSISNLSGAFYDGRLAGHARFLFVNTNGAEFSFGLKTASVDLQSLVRDVSPATNKLEGRLDGELTIVNAKTWDWLSWEGLGHVEVHEGLLWDIPVFGMFSTLLNSVSPGLGNARADQGSASFVITNSVIDTKDLELRAPTMRLKYRGTVDFAGAVNARVEAELLRDSWARIIGLVLTPMTKLFEYKVTGTIHQPKKEPLYLFPRLLLMPLQPFKTFKDLFQGSEAEKPPAIPPPKN